MLRIDPALVAAFVGKTALVGVDFVDQHGTVIQRTQVFGEVISIDLQSGLLLRNPERGEEYVLPPDVSAFEPAEPGEYQLVQSGERMSNPDFVAQLQVEVPPEADISSFTEVEVKP